MGLVLELEHLSSRITRTSIVQDGIRKLNSLPSGYGSSNGNNQGGFWGGIVKFTGFLLQGLGSLIFGGLTLTISGLWGLFVAAVGFLWNFNWNEPDEEYKKSIEDNFKNLAGLYGYALGDALGWLTCGALPTMGIATFNEALAAHIYEQLGETALRSIASNLAVALQQTFVVGTQALLTYAYMNVRSWIRGSDEDFKKKLMASGIVDKEKIQKAVEQRNKPWSFAKKYEDLLQTVPNEALRNFIDQTFQGFTNSCVEAGYVVAGAIDDYIASRKAVNDVIVGEDGTIEIDLNPDQVRPV